MCHPDHYPWSALGLAHVLFPFLQRSAIGSQDRLLSRSCSLFHLGESWGTQEEGRVNLEEKSHIHVHIRRAIGLPATSGGLFVFCFYIILAGASGVHFWKTAQASGQSLGAKRRGASRAQASQSRWDCERSGRRDTRAGPASFTI